MDLKQLEYIIAIADYGNITKAAEALFITQSGLNPVSYTHLLNPTPIGNLLKFIVTRGFLVSIPNADSGLNG